MSNPAKIAGGGAPLQVAYFVAVFIVLIILSVAVAREVRGTGSVEDEVVVEVMPAPQSRAPELNELVCFTCHSLGVFREGGDGAFPHEFHFEMVGVSDCHYCHAFNIHEPVFNREDCAMCH